MPLGLGLRLSKLSLGLGLGQSFYVPSLFAASEQGVWYDPSDLTSMYQDSAGTTAAAYEQPVGLLLDKRLGLVRGVEEILDPEFNDASKWTLSPPWSVSGGKATHNGSSADYIYTATEVPVVGEWYEVTVVVSAIVGVVSVYLGQTPASYNITTVGATKFIARSPGAGLKFSLRCSNAVGGNTIVESFSVKKLQGNHATQATTAQKPILSARKNLLTKTETFSDAGTWAPQVAGMTVTPNAIAGPIAGSMATRVIASVTAGNQRLQQTVSHVGGASSIAVYAKAGLNSGVVVITTWDGVIGREVTCNLTTGATTPTGPNCTGAASPIGNGWWRVELRAPFAASSLLVGLQPGIVANGTDDVYLWGAQAEYGSTATRYQRVNTATDYDTVGFPHYLKFDGVDDFMTTSAIDFTASDKMTMWAGVEKLTDNLGMPVELSANSNSNAGSFYFAAGSNGPNHWSLSARGSLATTSAGLVLAGRDKAVITSIVDISTDLTRIRRNGVQGTDGSGDHGTGNFGNYQLYLGRRGGTSLPFNGNLFTLTVRGAASTAAQITNGETHTATKTGVTL